MIRNAAHCLTPMLLALTAACSSNPPMTPGPSTMQQASCGATTITAPATAGQVLAACGQPSYRDGWGTVATVKGPDLAPVEEWYYNPGPQGPVQVLRFLNGQLIAVNRDGDGFVPETSAKSCATGEVTHGLSKYRLIEACGQPLTRQAYVVDPSFVSPNSPVFSQGNALIEGNAQNGRVAVYREDLSYSIDGKVQTVTLQNGRVFEVNKVASRN